MKRKFYRSCIMLLSIVVACSSGGVEEAKAQNKPNILFILVDDLGWKDLGVQGSEFYLTPRIDTLANEGVRFTNAYAANPVCSPTRASIMSGKDPADESINITNWIGAAHYDNRKNKNYKLIQPKVATELALEEITMAEAFKENGYATYFAGKWHLGEEEKYWPENQGFEVNKGGWSRGNPGSFFSPYNNPRLEDGPDGEYLPFRLGREVVGFLDEHNSKHPDQPFFIYFAMYNVHTPIEAPEKLVKRFEARRNNLGLPEKGEYEVDKGVKNRIDQSDATYAAMVWAMDSVVGMVVDKLQALGLKKNTAIVLFSDNGGLSAPGYGVTTNKPLRGGKGWIYEGGIREPLIVKYPPLTDKLAGKVIDEPVVSHDFYPTLLQLAHLPLKPKQHLQGKSFFPLLKGQDFDRGPLFWHYPHYSPQKGKPASAVREGNWKLIHFYEDDAYELYNLEEDLAEENNVAALYPEKVKKMGKKLDQYLRKIGASFPEKAENVESY